MSRFIGAAAALPGEGEKLPHLHRSTAAVPPLALNIAQARIVLAQLKIAFTHCSPLIKKNPAQIEPSSICLRTLQDDHAKKPIL